MTGSRMNVNNSTVAATPFSTTDVIDKTEASETDASALIIALALACDPSSGFSRPTTEEVTQPTVLARHGKEYQEALQKAIKKSSSFQKSMADDMNAMFLVANHRREEKDEDACTRSINKVDHLDVGDLFKDVFTNEMVTPQVAGDTKIHEGLYAPRRPSRHAALLSKYVSTEAMLSNIKEVDLHVSASFPPSENGKACRSPAHPEFKLRPRSRTLEGLRDQLSDSALLVPNTDSTASTGGSRSKSLPSYYSSATGTDSLEPTSRAADASLAMPSLPYPKDQSICKEEKFDQSRVVASNISESKKINNPPAFFLQRRNTPRNTSRSGGLSRSFSALTLRRSTSSTFKNASKNGLDRKNSTTNMKEAKKTSPSHPNLRRSASSKSSCSFRRRSSRGSFSSLRRHRVGIADIPAHTAPEPSHNAVW